MSGQRKRLERYLFRTLQKTCERYQLFKPGDRVAVGVSGGKDSYTLLYLMHQLTHALPFEVSILALHLDQAQPGYDGAPLRDWLRKQGFAYEILREDTYSVVTDRVSEGQTYCSLCSRLRRGILYTAMQRLGYNKLALGHHRNDALETLLMNLFFSGKLQAMPATYRTDNGQHDVLRPLIDCDEAAIQEYSELMNFPVLPCNLCGSQPKMQRQRMRDLIDSLERQHPNIRSVMMRAISNVSPTHLLDQDVAEAWEHRPARIQPAVHNETPVHYAQALPWETSTGPRRLPILDKGTGTK